MFLEHIHTPSVQEDPFTEEPPQPKSATDPTKVEVPAVVDLIMEVLVITPDWTVPYIAYILRKELPEDEEEVRQIVRRSKAFTVIRGQLFRESVTGVQTCALPISKIGSKREAIPSNVFLEHIHTPSVQEDPFTEEPPQPKSATDPTEVEVPAVVNLIMEVLVITPDWTVPYIAYILRKELPED